MQENPALVQAAASVNLGSSRRSVPPDKGEAARQPPIRALGPLQPDNPGRALPGSISRPDVRAWRSEIDGSQSALRDKAAIKKFGTVQAKQNCASRLFFHHPIVSSIYARPHRPFFLAGPQL